MYGKNDIIDLDGIHSSRVVVKIFMLAEKNGGGRSEGGMWRKRGSGM